MTKSEPRRDPDHIPLDDLSDAMAVYSADGQIDDPTGGDAGAEEEFGHEAHPRGEKGVPPSPEGRTGPS